MNLLKRTIGVLALISIFAMAVVASEPNPVSCSPTGGIIQTPPCASTQSVTDDLNASTQRDPQPASNTFDITSIVEEALMAFLLF